MKVSINVENRKEGEMIRQGLDDLVVRAFVQVMGALATLPSDRARHRVMTFVADHFQENSNPAGGASP